MSEANPQAMNDCLRAVWMRTQRKCVVGGLLAFVRWFVPMFVLVIVIDRYAYFPGWLRGTVAAGLAVVALRQAWRHGWSRLQAFDAMRTARRVEHACGGMDSLLVTAVQFEASGASPGTSAAMWELTQRKAQEAAASIEPGNVITMRDLKHPLRVAAVIGAVLLVVVIVNGSFLAAGLGRLFTPWLAIDYPTDTIIELGDGELVVKEGAAATLAIRLSGDIPEDAELALRTGDGRPREIELEVVDGGCSYEIASASRDFSYRVKAGDARSDWRQVRVVPAPRVAQVKVVLDYPDYIDRGNDEVEALTLTVPEETKVRWQLTLDTPIREATLHRDGADDLPLEIADDGRSLTLEETASASRGYSFSWVEDGHGFDFESPRYFLQVAADQAPRIELTSPVANLSAMLGRPLQLAVRAQDDHGIGSTTIRYRINRRPEKEVVLDQPVRSGDGEQLIGWDYRQELGDLQIGDSVSFVVEVADKYPGEKGPHRARTDSRRITFLSREDYLAEVGKQMERLLTRVRTLYRQERAAHELVRALDPHAESFVATCQLEAIRQEMVREQLVATANEVQALLDDLAANQVSDAVESDALAAMRDGLRAIAHDHVARAAELMRAQVGAGRRDPEPAVAAVNQAARELAGLVLQRGIDAAREVFARETRVLAHELARHRLLLLTAPADRAAGLAEAHRDIAGWVDDLLVKLGAGMRYDKKALHVLGLNRRIHHLRTTKLSDAIRDVATLAAGGKLAEAALAQYPLIRPLLEAEFTMRSGAEYALAKALGEQLDLLIAEQERVLLDCERDAGFSSAAAGVLEQQSALRDRLVLMLLPSVPAPRTALFDRKLPPAPPVDECRLRAESLMAEALVQMQSKDGDASAASARHVLDNLRELDGMLDRWIDELAQMSLGVSAEVSDATDRAGVVEALESRQIALLEQTEEAALDEQHPKHLADDQQAMAEELVLFRRELADGGDQSALPLVGRLEAVERFMAAAAGALRAQREEDALEPQEQAVAALAEARELAHAQLARFGLLQQLIGFEQSVARASGGMADVVGGQNDLISLTEVADEESLPALVAPQRNLLQCLTDIAPSLDLVASRLDVGTPLVFAASDVEDALMAMEDGDAEDAAEIQGIAVESLAKVQALVAEISVQTGYVAEIVEFLHAAQSELAMLAFRQRQLREGVGLKDLYGKQQALAADATKHGALLTDVAGRIEFDKLHEKVREKFDGYELSLDFSLPAQRMYGAAALVHRGEDAGEAMEAAEKSLWTSSAQLSVIIEMINGLPGIVLTHAEPPELHRLIEVLDIASKQRVLLRRAHGLAGVGLSALAREQDQLVRALAATNEGELQHQTLSAAGMQLQSAVGALESASERAVVTAQLEGDKLLRHFIIEQALILNTAIPPASSSDSDILTESETNDLYDTEAVGFVSDFVSGEGPKDKDSEWEFLGTRNRAALNQNFARELPLEYRATLKNYYERVAK